MPSALGEITKTLLRLSRRGEARPAAKPSDGEAPGPRQSPVRDGAEFGHYRIVKRLGSGGMGHVYLAVDSRLGRKVALKFLSPALVADEEMLRRLQAEARTASALNHPNILTIYEIGKHQGEHYIASEYVDGQTLRSAINKKSLDVQTGIDVICQVLSALAAAHAAGIIHRDLKPGNIMIRPDGYVKVIDFGLAKRTRKGEEETWAANSITKPGVVVGTVYYMSPEQVCGDTVDHRTDIWSLGVILFELLTRRRPFDGDSENRVIVNICSKPLPTIPDTETLPAGLNAVVERALQKDPAERYQSAREMLDELSTVGFGGAKSATIRTAVAPAPRRKGYLWATGAVAAILIACVPWLANRQWGWFGPSWTSVEPVRQLTFNGLVQLERISPDGKYLAYVAGDPNGAQTLYLKQVDSAAEEVKVPARNIQYVGLNFSPDSQYIYASEKDGAKVGKLFAIPIVGSRNTAPLLVDIDGPVSFSPDATHLAFVRRDPLKGSAQNRTEGGVYVASADGSGVKKLFSTVKFGLFRRPVWSPRGDSIAVFGSTSAGGIALLLIDLKGNIRQIALPGWRRVGQPWWAHNGKSIVTTAAAGIESDVETQIREIDVQTGRLHDITRDLQGYRDVSVTNDGKSVAAIRLESKARIWVSVPGNLLHGTSIGAENERYPSLSWLDAEHLVVNSRRNRFPNLWLLDIASQGRTSFTDEPFIEQSAAVIPGTKSVVMVSNRSGQFHVWKFDSQTNQYTQLTFGSSYDEMPTVSPDGKWVIYTTWETNNPHLRKVSVDGGPSIQIGNYLAQDGQISPDGRSLVCLVQDPSTSTWQVVVTDIDGQGPLRPVPNAQLPVRWSPNSKSLTVAMTDRRGVSNLWNISLDGSGPRQLTEFDDGLISDFKWSPAGDQLACTRVNLGTDVVLFRSSRANDRL